jgi:hypothetical protein
MNAVAVVVVAEEDAGGGAVPEVLCCGRVFRVVAGTAAAANTKDHRATAGAAVRLDWSSVVDIVVDDVVVVLAGLALPEAAAVRLDEAVVVVVDRPVSSLLQVAPVSSFLLVVE